MRRALVATILVCMTTVVSHSFGRSTLGLLLPAIEDDLGLTHAQGGRPGTAIYLAYIVGVALVAALAHRLEPITIMRTALASAAIGLAIAASAKDLTMLTIGVGLTGGSGAGIWLTAPTLATTHVSPRRRGLVIAMLSTAISVSNIALGFGTTVLRNQLDNKLVWRPIWAFETAFTVVLLIAIIVVARFGRTKPVSGGFSFETLRQVPHWARATVAYALFGSVSAGFGAFILVAMEEQGPMSRGQATTMFSVMGIVGMATTPVVGALSDRYGRRPFMLGALSVLSLANLLVARGGMGPVIAAVIGFGAMAGTFPALVATYVRDHVTDRTFSRVLATMTLLFSLTAAATPSTVGWLADESGGFRLPFLLLAAVAAVAVVAAAGLSPTAPALD